MCKLLKMIICRLSQESTDQLLLNGTRMLPSKSALFCVSGRWLAMSLVSGLPSRL